jgi:integrase
MARQAKPYLYRGWYCTNAGEVPHHKLCREEQGYKEAEICLARLIVQRDDTKKEGKLNVPGPGIRTDPTQQYGPGLAGPQPKTVAEVYDDFMSMVQAEHAKETYIWYQGKLKPFFERFATRPITSIKYKEGLAYKTWLTNEKPWMKGKIHKNGVGKTTVNMHIRTAKTLFNWALLPSHEGAYGITINPWMEIMETPVAPKERLITEEEFQHLLANCHAGNVQEGAQDFRDMLSVLRYTTMRPGELRLLEWEYVQFDQHRIVWPPHVVKTRRRREAVLIDRAKAVLLGRKARLEEDGNKVSGYVFPVARTNTQGKRTTIGSKEHQTANALAQRVRRLMDRCVAQGLIEREKQGQTIVAYTNRHTRITQLIIEGNNPAVVMADAGHVNPMTTERYKHLAGSFVADSIRKRDKDASTAGGAG